MVPLVIFALLMPVILFYKRAWVARLVQIVFVLGAIEWIRTTLIIISERQSNGESWIRVAIILGAVAVFTFCSGMLFSWSCSLRKIYGLDKSLICEDIKNADVK